ncbi:MAG: tetratricopeptide repeat protein [Vampirovibrionales bacterium]|nr:tetratricopeptide repeat protein [Vampirovibrionales bacterium]
MGLVCTATLAPPAFSLRAPSTIHAPLYSAQQPFLDTAQADLLRASALAQDDRCDQALPLLRQAVDKSPDQVMSVYPMALCLFEAAMNEGDALKRRHVLLQAEDAFLRAQTLNPQATLTYMKLGKIALLRGDARQAIRYYKLGLAVMPANAVLLFNLASVYDDVGDSAQALALYEKTLAVDSRFLYAYNNLGLLYDARGDSARAQSLYRSALRVNPSYNYARLNLAKSLARANRLPQAERQLTRAVAVEPDNPWAYLYLGDVYLRRNAPEKAARAYEASIRLNPRFAPPYYLLAIAYGKARRYDEALQAALGYLRLDPSGDHAREAIALMAALRLVQIETARRDAEPASLR